jgi:site-specific recombinase XerD
MTPLRQRMIEDLKLRNLSENTIKAYVRAVLKYAEFFHRSPDQLGREELRTYLLFLREEKRVAQGTFNQKVAALRTDTISSSAAILASNFCSVSFLTAA